MSRWRKLAIFTCFSIFAMVYWSSSSTNNSDGPAHNTADFQQLQQALREQRLSYTITTKSSCHVQKLFIHDGCCGGGGGGKAL